MGLPACQRSGTDKRSSLSLIVLVASVGVASIPSQAAGQRAHITVEAGGSQILAPAEAGGGAARFLVGGVRAEWPWGAGDGLSASVAGGRSAAGGVGGNYWSGDLAASAWLTRGGWGMVGLRARALGFRVTSPVLYSVVGAEGGPTLLVGGRTVSLRLDALGGVGRSHTRYEALVEGGGGRPGGYDHMGGGYATPDSVVVTTVDADLWRYGGNAEFLVKLGPGVVGAAAGMHESSGGAFRFVGLRAVVSRDRFSVGGRLDTWSTPTGRQPGAALWVSLDLGGGWGLRGLLGKTEPDPLTLASATAGGGGVLVGRRFGIAGPGRGRATLYETLEETGEGMRVRLYVRPRSRADSVQVTGDFTLWEPRPMQRQGGVWVTELKVPPGVYHFGFLVDGQWFIPEEAQDAVPDEWGRRNATLVVEREGEP